MKHLTVITLLAAVSLPACVAPTSYRAAGTDGKPFGHTATELKEQLHRVRFVGSTRTPPRWADAFVLYRCAEIAQEARAPAFRIIEGAVNPDVLIGDEVFGGIDTDVNVLTTASASRSSSRADTVIGVSSDPAVQRTAGSMPMFRAPMPPLKAPAPLFIYTPGY